MMFDCLRQLWKQWVFYPLFHHILWYNAHLKSFKLKHTKYKLNDEIIPLDSIKKYDGKRPAQLLYLDLY